MRIVTLSPSTYSWHLDYAAEKDLEQGDYKLKKLGKDKTRPDIVFKNTWKNGSGPSRDEFEADTKFTWDAFAPAPERDFALKKP